jgi:glutaredoxin
MSNYYLLAVLLENCGYSTDALQLIQKYSIPHQIINVSYNEIEKYKTNKIKTFPQIYLARNDAKGTLLLGGYDDLNAAINTFIKKPINENVNNFMKKYNWSKKGTLRLIQLFNN